MRKADNDNFILAYFLNLALNPEWAIPAIILLLLHFRLDIPIILFWIALGLWLGGTLIAMILIALIRKSVGPDKPSENKNPYSASTASVLNRKKDENVK